MEEINKDYLSGGKNYDENKIRVGSNFQASIPSLRSRNDDIVEPVDSCVEDQLLWQPSRISENSVNIFLNVIKSYPSRKLSEEQVLYLLHQCDYDTDEAYRRFQLLPDPVADAGIWSEDECKHFERVLQFHGKKFHMVTKIIPSKSVKDVVEFYYFWKRSERYDAFINDKNIHGQSKFKKRSKRKGNRSVDPADAILDEEQLLSEDNRLIYPIFPLNNLEKHIETHMYMETHCT